MDIAVPNADRSSALQAGTSPRTCENMEHVVEYGIAGAYFARNAAVLAVWTTIQGRGK
jgi:hypothetical protein